MSHLLLIHSIPLKPFAIVQCQRMIASFELLTCWRIISLFEHIISPYEFMPCQRILSPHELMPFQHIISSRHPLPSDSLWICLTDFSACSCWPKWQAVLFAMT